MTTTPTFRVADGMLKENARMEHPELGDPKYADSSGSGTLKWLKDTDAYDDHLASLRSIPIAPGCVLEGESLVEGVDFRIEVDYSQGTGSPEYAWPIDKESPKECKHEIAPTNSACYNRCQKCGAYFRSSYQQTPTPVNDLREQVMAFLKWCSTKYQQDVEGGLWRTNRDYNLGRFDRKYATTEIFDEYLTSQSTPPARAFSLAEALEIWKAGYDYRCSLFSETYCDNLAFGFPDKKTYFKQRFNIDI